MKPDSMYEAMTRNNMGRMHFKSNDMQNALEHYQKALAIMEVHVPNSFTIATTLHNIGEAYVRNECQDAALQYYQRALEIRQGLAV